MAPPARVLVVAGPTAVGKSSAALRLCEARDGEVGECRQRAALPRPRRRLEQAVAGGTTKGAPPSGRRRGRIAVPWSAGAWCAAAAEAIGDVARRGKLPVVVGGTMMYAQWLVRGAPDAPKASATAAASAQDRSAPHGDDWEKARDAVAGRSDACAARVAKLLAERLLPPVARAGDRARSEAGGGSAEARRPVLGSDFDVRARSSRRRTGPRCTTLLMKGATPCSCAASSRRTANLRAVGRLPSSSTAARAIGYRQALDYLEARVGRSGRVALDSHVYFCRQFRTASAELRREQLKWYRRDATFAIVPAGDDAALATLLDLDGGARRRFFV